MNQVIQNRQGLQGNKEQPKMLSKAVSMKEVGKWSKVVMCKVNR